MSRISAESVVEAPAPSHAFVTALGIPAAVWILAVAHGLVDCHATFVQPLWPSLGALVRADESGMQWTYMAWSLAGSITQLGFARLADKGHGRRLLWWGPLAGIALIGMIGSVTGLAAMTAVLVVSNLGFAAFHPEAATLAGAAAPGDRARAMSIFAVGGYLGQALGPSLSGVLVSRGGLDELMWTIAPGLAVCLMLIVALRSNDARRSRVNAPHLKTSGPASHKTNASAPMREILRGREWPVAHLVCLSVLRVAAAMGVPISLAYGLAARGVGTDVIGETQSVFLMGMGAGTLACAFLVNARNENAVIWLAPLGVAAVLPIAALGPISMLKPLMAICGPLMGLSLPILTSRGQELLPHAPRVGSSLTMGVTWGLGGILVAALMAVVGATGDPFHAFFVLAVWSTISGLMCWPGWAMKWRATPESLEETV
ncbi:MFS transporter [bacterium]|nr:MFS transporter [bacterium]